MSCPASRIEVLSSPLDTVVPFKQVEDGLLQDLGLSRY